MVCIPRGDMKKYTHYIVEYINKFRSSMRCDEMNDPAWEVFLYSSDKRELRQAAEWMKYLISVISDDDFQKVTTLTHMQTYL